MSSHQTLPFLFMTMKGIYAEFGQVLLVHVTKIQVVKSVGLLAPESLGRLGKCLKVASELEYQIVVAHSKSI